MLIVLELNYNIYNKELLTIVKALQHQRIYLERAKYPIQVITNHKNLTYFTIIKVLTKRQARQLELLAIYNFRIKYRKGLENTRVDILSRQIEYKGSKLERLQ